MAGACAALAHASPDEIIVPFVHWREDVKHCGRRYGHIWKTVYSFFLFAQKMPPASNIVIPSSATDLCPGRELYTEIEQLFNSSRLRVRRASFVPVCASEEPKPDRKSQASCQCSNDPRVRPMVVDMEQPCMQGERSAEKTTVALRSHVFAAHPQLGLGGCASREVVFISSAKAASVRRILHEDRLVAALRRTAAALSPPWSLTVLEPSALSYLDELSLLGGARVVIALFSSALHSCRFLAPGTTVIELHGALRDDFGNAGYYDLCTPPLGLRYIGVRTSHAMPRGKELSYAAFHEDGQQERRDFSFFNVRPPAARALA